MRTHSKRWRVLRQTGWWLLFITTGLVLLIGASTIKVISASDQALQRRANQAQVLGLAVTIMGAALRAIRRQQRLYDPTSSADVAEMLALRVRRAEEGSRMALLGDTVAANLTFTLDNPQPRPRSADRSSALRLLLNLTGYHADQGGLAGNLESIDTFFSSLEPQRLVILGEPGSGKTVMAIELVLRLLERRHLSAAQSRDGHLVPVRINLAGWDTSRDLEDWLVERLLMDYQIPMDDGRRLVEERCMLPVLDGLDEMDPDSSSDTSTEPPRRALAALIKLNHYVHGSQRAALVVTCRQHRYTQLQEHNVVLRDAKRIRILPLDAGQIRTYIETRFDNDHPHHNEWWETFNKLDSVDGAAVKAALSTPWRLHLATVLSQARQPPSELLRIAVGQDQQVAAERIDRLLLARYVPAATELAALRQRAIRYDPDIVAIWLRHLAAQLDWQSKMTERMEEPPSGLSGMDLVPHLLWPIGGWWTVRLLHGFFGFLIAAVGLTMLSVSTFGRSADPIMNALSPRSFSGHIISAILSLLTVWLVTRFCLKPWPTVRYAARSAVPMRHRVTLGLRMGLRVGVSSALGGGLAVGLRFGSEFWRQGGIIAGIVGGIVGTIVGTIGAGIVTGFTFGSRSGFRPDLRRGMIHGVTMLM